MPNEQLIQNVVDRESIRQLPILYCHYVRMKDAIALADLFTEDGVFEVDVNLGPAASGTHKGRAALEKMYRHSIATVDPWPFAHNHVIELTGPESATGVVYVELRMGSENMRVTSIGIYHDEYVKVGPETWKFRSRRVIGNPIPK